MYDFVLLGLVYAFLKYAVSQFEVIAKRHYSIQSFLGTVFNVFEEVISVTIRIPHCI